LDAEIVDIYNPDNGSPLDINALKHSLIGQLIKFFILKSAESFRVISVF